MADRSLKDKILYNKYSWLIPAQPLIGWYDTTRDLEKFYSRPEINLTDSREDIIKKNSMRHLVGLARMGQTYYNPLALGIGGIKEGLDYAKDFLTPSSFGYVTDETRNDTKIDWGNNLKGINFTDKYPNSSGEDIMKYAWGIANGAKPIEEQPKSNLYKHLIDNIDTVGNDSHTNFVKSLYGEIVNY